MGDGARQQRWPRPQPGLPTSAGTSTTTRTPPHTPAHTGTPPPHHAPPPHTATTHRPPPPPAHLLREVGHHEVEDADDEAHVHHQRGFLQPHAHALGRLRQAGDGAVVHSQQRGAQLCGAAAEGGGVKGRWCRAGACQHVCCGGEGGLPDHQPGQAGRPVRPRRWSQAGQRGAAPLQQQQQQQQQQPSHLAPTAPALARRPAGRRGRGWARARARARARATRRLRRRRRLPRCATRSLCRLPRSRLWTAPATAPAGCPAAGPPRARWAG
jgi:hypothetical protein